MKDNSLKKQRMNFFRKVFYGSFILSLLFFLLLLFLISFKSATAFFLSSILVIIDIFAIVEVSGMLLDSNQLSYSKLILFMFVKILLLTVGFYGILYFFKSESLYVFAGLSLPIAVFVLLGFFDRSS